MFKNSGNQNSIGDILSTGSAILTNENLPIVQTLEELFADVTVFVSTFPWFRIPCSIAARRFPEQPSYSPFTRLCFQAIALGTKLYNPEGLTLTLRDQLREESPLQRNFRPMHNCCRHSIFPTKETCKGLKFERPMPQCSSLFPACQREAPSFSLVVEA